MNDDPLLLWVRSGALVLLADEVESRLVAGEALWVPSGLNHALRLEHSTVAVWVLHSNEQQPAHEMHTMSISEVWGDWLVHRHSVGRSSKELLLELAAGPSRGTPSTQGGTYVPMPRSREALAVAQTLLHQPGSPLRIEALAARERINAKTLQRQFLRETGIGYSQWRTRVRMRAAAALLTAGRGVAAARRHVGYGSASGFTHAFQRYLGMTPSQYAERQFRGRGSRSASMVDEMGSHPAVPAAEGVPLPPQIRPYSGPVRVNDCHVLLWIYRGEGVISIGTREMELHQGEATWVPAGVSHQVRLAADSILLPLGNRYGRSRITADDLCIFSLSDEPEDYLLHTYLAEYFPLLQPEHPPRLTDELFEAQYTQTTPQQGELAGVVGTVAAALRREPASSKSLADWAKALGAKPAALGNEFIAQTGLSFPRWRARLRMDIARELLYLGERSGDIARRLGYSGPSAFTKVFTAAHGVAPREYQRKAFE